MPVYELAEPGKESPRMVKEKDVAAALLHATGIAIKAIGAERMIELQEAGVTLEKPTEPDPADPANYAPGGPLHGKTKPASVIAAEQTAEAARGGQSGEGGGGTGGEGSEGGGAGKAAAGKGGKEG